MFFVRARQAKHCPEHKRPLYECQRLRAPHATTVPAQPIPWDFQQGERDGTADGRAGVAPLCQAIMVLYSAAYQRGYRSAYDAAIERRLHAGEDHEG